MMQNGTHPLSMSPIGETVQLININAGKRLVHRLTELGMTPGVQMSILQDAGGPLLIAVRDSRVALGRGMAQKMMVKVMEN